MSVHTEAFQAFKRLSSVKKKKERTCGICEPEGDRLVFDVAHIADGHLACVISKVFGSEVLELQHLGLTLWDKTHTGLHHAKRQIFYVANINDAHKHLSKDNYNVITFQLNNT